jgi:hypothetical protein
VISHPLAVRGGGHLSIIDVTGCQLAPKAARSSVTAT